MVIPGIGGWTWGWRLAAAVVVLAVWLAPAGGVWLYMRGAATAERALGAAECQAANVTQVLRSVEEHADRMQQRQQGLDEAARADSAVRDSALQEFLARARAASAALARQISATPLPPDCRGDAARVQFVNEARRP